MPGIAGATGPKTSPHRGDIAPFSDIKSTPMAAGMASVSESVGTLGLKVDDISPWISQDVETYTKCKIDSMIEELLYRCRDKTELDHDKSALLRNALKAVLKVCNKGKAARDIKAFLNHFIEAPHERHSYTYFVGAANTALLQLQKIDVHGIVSSKDDQGMNEIHFHHNDYNMYQMHQGEQCSHKPDVVVVPRKAAHAVQDDGDLNTRLDVFAHFCRTTRNFGRANDATSAPGPLTERRQSERLKNRGKKRTSDNLGSNSEPKSKRLKSNDVKAKDEEQKKHPVIENGLYDAAHVARQNVIFSVIRNDILYVLHFDRQDAIQCSGFNFIQDLPRFMVLLLIMQRLPCVHWGLNLLFACATGAKPKIAVEDKVLRIVDLKFDLEAENRMTHYGLCDRATNVFPVESKRLSKLLKERPSQNTCNGMVAKLYWPEQLRESEIAILKKVQAIAEKNPDVNGHVPQMVWFHEFGETSTASIRKILGVGKPDRGSRTLYVIVFRRLVPITTLSRKKFLKAWWQVVLCHRILWINGILHRDISPSNLMVYKNASNERIGVLNDYDLSSTQQDGPSGNERTGTIRFMAIELLPKATKEKFQPFYRHDAESLIWVLAWVCLRYEDGKLRSSPPLNEWLKADAQKCRVAKSFFLLMGCRKAKPSPSHKVAWETGRACLHQVMRFYVEDPTTPGDDEVFQTWLRAQVPTSIRESCPPIR